MQGNFFTKTKSFSLCIRTNSSYTFIGEEPVAKTNTQDILVARLDLIKSAISRATIFEA